jgi:hypothetical protein
MREELFFLGAARGECHHRMQREDRFHLWREESHLMEETKEEL